MACSPTRAMLLTGTDNHIAGLGNMEELLTPAQKGKPGYEGHLNDRVVTLAELLRAGGYHTYMSGKWHLGDEPEFFPGKRGFERTLSLLEGGGSHWSDMAGLRSTSPIVKYSQDGKQLKELPKDFYSSRSYVDHLMQSVRENRGDGKPFFAYLSFTAAHDPIHVPEPWLSMYRGRYDDGYEALKAQRAKGAKRVGLVPEAAVLPERHDFVKAWDSLSDEERAYEARCMEAYAGLISCMDYNYGRFIDFLQDIGEYDNTLIILISDNGTNPWTSDEYPSNAGSAWFKSFDNSLDNIGHPGSFVGYGVGWATASAGPLDYFKFTVGEGGIRTPLIVGGPLIEARGQIDSFAYVWDITPTLLELTGIAHPDSYAGHKVAPTRGRSLSGVLFDGKAGAYAEDVLVGGEMLGGKWMRQGDLKAVLVTKPYGPDVWRLYDTVSDPGETEDLSRKFPDVLKELKAGYERYAKDVGVVD